MDPTGIRYFPDEKKIIKRNIIKISNSHHVSVPAAKEKKSYELSPPHENSSPPANCVLTTKTN